MDENVIKRAKSYAKSKGVSVSEVVEKYLSELADKKPEGVSSLGVDENISALVSAISGVVSLPPEFDEKLASREERLNKHQ